jgi:hypothetical protein
MSFATDNLIAAASPTTTENSNLINFVGKAMFQKNTKGLYFDTKEDKDIIFEHLDKKLADLSLVENETYPTGKNLLYFTIFTNEKYLEMLDISLRTIVKNTPTPSFDVLFITDEEYKPKILALDIVKQINAKFHVVESPSNGIEASFNKLRIHEYENIKEYEKILYLDADVIALKNVNELFDLPLVHEKLHTKTNMKNQHSVTFTSPTHGLMYLTEKQADFIEKNTNILPLNAGQFLFLNSSKMIEHFKNVRWLKSVWPGLYFFEQSFLNHYFALNGLVEQVLLKNIVEIVFSATVKSGVGDPNKTKNVLVSGATNSIYSPRVIILDEVNSIYADMTKQHTDDTILIHFAGFTLRGAQKVNYINTYANAHIIQL